MSSVAWHESDYETVSVSVSDGVAELMMNRPEQLNALSITLKRELGQVIDFALGDPSVSMIVLTGAGRSFCSGADLRGMSESRGLTYRKELRKLQDDLIVKLWESEKIVIAGVQGYAAGAGFSIALASDIVVAEEGATFYAPFVTGPAVVPDTGIAYLLPKAVGVNAAMHILLTAQRVPATEAAQLGIVQRLVPTGSVRQGIDETIAALRRAAPQALALTKTLVHKGLSTDLREVLEQEAFMQALLRMSDDHAEGIKAFAEQRAPHFTGS
ncbi:enoyl-CoA hydratase-related protein [soil metagenome]